MTRKLAQYRGPTAETDAMAVRDAEDAAYGFPKKPIDTRTGQPVLGGPDIHMVAVERDATGAVYAVFVFTDAETGLPFWKQDKELLKPITANHVKTLTAAVVRAENGPDWDPDKPATAAQVTAAAEKEVIARDAYDAQLALDPKDLKAAALAAKAAVVEQ